MTSFAYAAWRMSDFDGADATPRSKLPGSCSLEPVTNAEGVGPPSLSVAWARFGAGVFQSVPAWLTTRSPSPPSKVLGGTVIAAEAATADIANSAHAARRAAKNARAIVIWEVMAVLAVVDEPWRPSL